MKQENIFEKIFSFFNKSKYSKENQITAEESMTALRHRMEILNQKALNLKDNYPDQRAQIQNCLDLINSIEPSASVRAGKFEQQISVAITQVSTACDKIFTNKDVSKLESLINALLRSIRERQNADIVQEE
ncbi:MAG: hypothetical protein ACI4LX_05890 [Treponema sp.]